MGDHNTKIMCYADDAVLVAQKMISNDFSSKTKCLTTSETSIRCKLVVEFKIIQPEIKFKYLGIELSEYGDIDTEVRQQTTKALRDPTGHNKNKKASGNKQSEKVL